MNFLKLVPAQLVLQNGMTFQGHAPEWFEKTAFGEVVFTTGMTGYIESLEENSLPQEWSVLFRNINDASVEGICHKNLPHFAVQFHPEAAPGPTDTIKLFEKFYHML